MGLFEHGAKMYSGLVCRLPWWLSFLAGLACAAVGAILMFRPFSSLGAMIVLLAVGLIVSGISEWFRSDRPGTAVLSGLTEVAAGVLVLVLPGLTIRGLTLIVGAALIVTGAANGLRSMRGTSDQRVADGMFAVSSVILGLLALVWPDVTVFIIAALFGVRLGWFGVDQIVRSFRRARGTAMVQPNGTVPRRRWVRGFTAVLALTGSIVLALVSAQLSGTPRPDAFYSAPNTVPDTPGQLLRADSFSRAIPDGATAWRILYTTTNNTGAPAIASGIVVVPDGPGAHPAIAWAHGTTGLATGCAPSLLEDPFGAGAMPNLDAALAQGWAIVATDYTGLGTPGTEPYLIGQGEGRSVLDSIRAAQQLPDAELSGESVIWGHSQGGHAALWAGGLASSYAPELAIRGVAAIAPATNLPALMDGLQKSAIGGLFGSFALGAYTSEYPDVHTGDYVRPGARIMVESMQQRCLTDPSTLVSLATTIFSDKPIWSQSPGDGAFAARAAENVPTLPIRAPVLLAQGGADTLILPTAQDAYVADRCALGQVIDYRTYPGYDHMGVVTGDSPLLPELQQWTQKRFDGEPAATSCGTE